MQFTKQGNAFAYLRNLRNVLSWIHLLHRQLTILSHKQNKRLLKNFKKPRDIIRSQKTTKLWSFLTVLLEIQTETKIEQNELKPKFLWFFPLFPGNQTVKVKQTLKQLIFYFSFENPRRLRNSKLCEWEWRLYQTSVHLAVLYQIFRLGDECEIDWVREEGDQGRWWMFDGVGEDGEWERRWSVRVRGWDWSGLCEREGEWESGYFRVRH